MLEIYNTLSRQRERFKPLRQEEVKIYFCGPTVYNYAHIGNLKTAVIEDIVVRSVRFLGYRVKTVMNITDVDDKTIRESQAAGETLALFTEKYTEIFLQDISKLAIETPDIVEPVTHLIPEIVSMIHTMLKRGYAYYAEDGSIYFDISKSKNYGKLAHLDFSGMKTSVRINNDEYEKESAADFVIWKAWKGEDGENFWEERFLIGGQEKILKGRPGWHIECSACNMKHLWPQIDIHMWGEDLIFPHHQNEIAQTEACTGKTFSKYWIHSGHLMVEGKKMSKSLGNFYNLRDIETHFQDIKPNILYRALRLCFISWKYRDTLDFSFEKLTSYIQTVQRIDNTLKRLRDYIPEKEKIERNFREELQIFIGDFVVSLEDDFNTPEALAVFFEYQKYISERIHTRELSLAEQSSAEDMYRSFNQVLQILDESLFQPLEQNISPEILEKLEARNKAKQEKNYTQADTLRDELLLLGYKIVDTKEGTELEKI
jgi:cysteinyl-tRNA synthetase